MLRNGKMHKKEKKRIKYLYKIKKTITIVLKVLKENITNEGELE